MGHEYGTVEKIFCCDRGDNDALIATLANRRDNDGMLPALLMNDNNSNTAQNIEIQSQLDSLRSQMQYNQNTNALMDAIKGVGCDINQLATQLNCDFNTLNASICDVRMGISKLSGEIGFSAERVINAVTLGNCNLIQQLKDCCCTTQKMILEQEVIRINWLLKDRLQHCKMAWTSSIAQLKEALQLQTMLLRSRLAILSKLVMPTLNVSLIC